MKAKIIKLSENEIQALLSAAYTQLEVFKIFELNGQRIDAEAKLDRKLLKRIIKKLGGKS